MLPPRSLQIRRLLTRRYVVALALMAVLAVTEQVFVQTEFAKHLNNAREVNLAGRQRMLSQRLAKKAVAAAVAMETNVAALQAETALFAQVHRGLLDGDTEFELAGLQDPDLYADLDVLTEEVDRIEQSMAMLMTALAAGDSAATWHATQAAMAAETAFLPKMDRIVFRLAERTAVENQQARWIELVLLAATLVVLFMLGWLVFRPAATYAATAVNDAERQGRLLRAIIDTVPDHIYAKDLDGRATLRNVASAEALGYEHPEDGLGASDVDAPIEREVAHAVLEDDLRVVRTGTPVIDKEELFEVDGETRWLSTTKVPIFDASGAVTGLVGISRDITTSRAAKEALHDAKEAAEAATLAKSEFLANMSHEIRTPLNGVLGMTELLRETPLDDEQQEYIEVVHASGSALLSIINDVLDFSKIEAGHVELETQPFQLRTLIEDALDVVTVAATRAGLDLGYTVDPDVPTSLVGDAYRLRQVLTNLLSNAVKFTPGGGISVHVDLDAPPQHQTAALHIAVADTGIGIPAEKLDEVFGSFTQADASTTRQFGGTGLGLAISGHLIGLMGGELWAESEIGSGSTFHITVSLPLAPTADDASGLPIDQPHAEDPTALRGKHVLVVGARAIHRRALEHRLRAWGAEPIHAEGPAEATVWLATHPLPALTLLDQRLPSMDGLSLAAALRERYDADALPLVLLSALGDPVDRDACRQQGLAAVVTKPIKHEALWRALTWALRSHDVPPTALSPGYETRNTSATLRTQTPDGLRVLLVEDNVANQHVALTMLRRLGLDADLAENGQVALDYLREAPYDVVFMDVQMPVLDGIEATRQLRAAPHQFGSPYVIGLTANALATDRERCLAAGMDEHVPKPVRKRTLADVLARAQLG